MCETPMKQRLRIETVEATNFKCFKQVRVELGPLTILVGPNASGKSSLVDILSFISEAVREHLEHAIRVRGGFLSISRTVGGRGRPYDVTVAVTVAGNESETASERIRYDYGFTIGASRGDEFRVKHEWLRFSDGGEVRTLYEHRGRRWDHEPPEVKMQVPRTRLVLPMLSDNRVVRPLYDALKSMFFYRIYPSQLRGPQKPKSSLTLLEDGSNLASILFKMERNAPGAFSDLLGNLRHLLPNIVGLRVKQISGFLVVKLTHRVDGSGREYELELAQESDGTIRILGLLTAIHQEPPPSILGVEEPEIAVHPGIMTALAEILEEASLNLQVIITTHNPDLMNHFEADAIRVTEHVDGVARIGPLDEQQRSAVREKLFGIGDLLRADELRREQV